MEIKINNELSEHIENFTINSINLIDLIRPVGSLYWSKTNTDPSTIYPGTTWEAVTDKFIVAAGTTYKAGTSYGQATHTHTSAAHTHTVASHTHTTGNHTLTVAEIPSHVHCDNSSYGNGNSRKLAQWLVSNAGNVDGIKLSLNGDTSTKYPIADPVSIGGSGAHNHGNTGGTSLTTNSTTPGNTGSASNIPPSIAMYCWVRTA